MPQSIRLSLTRVLLPSWQYSSTFPEEAASCHPRPGAEACVCPCSPHFTATHAVCGAVMAQPESARSAALQKPHQLPTVLPAIHPLLDVDVFLPGKGPAFCLPRKRRFINLFFLLWFVCVSFTLRRQFRLSYFYFFLAWEWGRFVFIIDISVS